MSLSQTAGFSIMPLLARVVLCAAFLPAGLHKVMDSATFTGERAAILTDLGIGTPATEGEAAAAPTGVRFASFDQEEPPVDEETGIPEAELDQPIELDLPEMPSADEVQDTMLEDLEITVPPVRAKALHNITVMLAQAGWPAQWQPGTMAWVAALTELFGGVLILLGVFSRMWGLGLAIAMGFAFYLTSAPAMPELFTLAKGGDGYAAFNRMFAQLGLGLLALGVCCTGAGAVSLDRVLFKPSRRGGDDDDDLD